MNNRIHISRFADELYCPYCGMIQGTNRWPINGDYEGIYCQEEPGNYNLEMVCPHCRKKWYVVWDENPGEILPLSFK